MFGQLGLRSKMALSYVIITAATVLVVETILLGIISSWLSSARDSVADAQISVAQFKAKSIIAEDVITLRLAVEGFRAGDPVTYNDEQLLDAVAGQTFPHLSLTASAQELSAEVVATAQGRVVRSSNPALFPSRSTLPPDMTGSEVRSGTSGSGENTVAWASRPILSGSSARVIGLLYVQLPSPGGPLNQMPNQIGDPGWLLLPGAFMLLLLAPVGALFGLLSTNQLIRRIHRLGGVTRAVAEGNLDARIPVPSGDEVGRLEDGFNRMAERLEAAVQVERNAAGVEARQTERNRIATELHDSVSQNLYSMNLIAAGLRKALPEGSELRRQAQSLEQTVTLTMREMQALLLELRSVALEDGGLVPAIEELGRAYETRLGIRVRTDVAPVELPPEAEHALLRMAQEAMSNAARHGEPQSIEVSVAHTDGEVVLVVHDDGRGFKPAEAGKRYGMGLRLMRERVTELGGSLEIDSAPAQGTLVRVRIPGDA
jgi:signal transduction histidine kinase